MSTEASAPVQEQSAQKNQPQFGGEEQRESEEDVTDIIEWNIKNNAVFVFSDDSKSFVDCMKESQQVKEFLKKRGISFTSLELEHFENKDMYERAVKNYANRLTIPAVIINHSPIGGMSDLESFERDGSLDRVLVSAGVPTHLEETGTREEITMQSSRALKDPRARHRNMPPAAYFHWKGDKHSDKK